MAMVQEGYRKTILLLWYCQPYDQEGWSTHLRGRRSRQSRRRASRPYWPRRRLRIQDFDTKNRQPLYPKEEKRLRPLSTQQTQAAEPQTIGRLLSQSARHRKQIRLRHPRGRHDSVSFDTNHAQQSDTRELGIGQDPHQSSPRQTNYGASWSNEQEAR